MKAIVKGKRVLVLNRSASLINWLLGQGAKVAVSGAPIRGVEEHLKRTAPDGRAYERMKACLTWGASAHGPADLVVASPDDEAALFQAHWKKKIVGVVGAHGKTTVAVWAAHLIDDAIAVGGSKEKSLFAMMNDRARVAVVESSLPKLVVNTDDAPTPVEIPGFVEAWGEHNARNLSAAIRVAQLVGVPMKKIQSRVATLPQIPNRQQTIHRDKKIRVIDDSAARLPAHTVAAIRQWGGPNCILITGGAGHAGDVQELAQVVQEHLRPTNLVLLDGGATKAMRGALGSWARGVRSYATLANAWRAAKKRSRLFVSSVILFSPAAESSEQFSELVKGGVA